MNMIYHVATLNDWQACRNLPVYFPSNWENEGFIHCSLENQLSGVLERYFADKTDLVILHINESKLSSSIKYEKATNQESFPHIYGPIDKEAIVRVMRR